ncbi:CheR family methyltransferase [Spirosoma sp. KCTC 42546]|uniref:CheR family methyltransferase n=1 Tax=Spirosoma sp. KCTC 42546 TaxID=2520506 RepID=UPI001FEDE97E|nr:CheR family methyltransferase [Spirosoma sp. KCTC 42546]
MPKKKSSSDQSESTSSAIVPIVAIGASAGGMEAMTELLEHLSPMTGLAYVYIQHLDSNFDSQLASILGRATTMPVRQAKHLMRIEPDHVYVIPPNQDIEVVDGLLTLQPRQSNGSPHMPIDRFFIALADRQKEGSIGVLLSGMANDGTLGLRAIKVAGGITFAQDETARFQSMPKSAISENVVDRVLSPIEIAHELELLSGKPELFRQTEQADVSEDDETDEDIKAVILLLRRAVGVDFGNYKITTIRRRIIRRMLLFKLETLKAYANYIKQHPDEMELLYNDLLINVTTFFRDPETMDYLLKVLFPRIIKEKGAREPIRIWVPACSTGQEAYSLAILLIEALGDMASSMTIQVFATDLSEAAVAKARMGSYTKSEVMDVSARRLQRFFTKTDDHYRINRAVRDLCVFAPHNLLKDPPFSRLDFVSCRNLLIYLGSTYQRKAISLFHYGLNPNGYLLLGKSETVGSLTTLFAQVEKNYKIYIRKNDVVSRASFEMSPRLGFDRLNPDNPEPDHKGERFSGSDAPKRSEPASEAGFPVNDLEKTIDDLLLRHYVPASVVVNDDLDILRFRGSTSTFLEPSTGKASLNLLKMARPSLVFELRNTVHKARKAGQPVRKTGLEVKIKDKVHQVAIEVVPLRTDTEERLYLVLFEEVEAAGSVGTDLAEKRNRRIKQLEEELATLREDMRSIVEEQEASNEELQSANEEIISSNEELQSINEELETSKEEIESTNEELLTINQELQVRNDQLSEANEFSEVIFATIREATLVLDEDLRVKSANKTFYKLFRVDEDQTQGRLIYELGNRQWDIPALRLLLSDVIRHNVQVDSFEVTHTFTDIGEKVLLVNARRIVRNQEAILLAIEDITEHRRAQRLLAEREAWLHNLVENAPVLIWVSDANGQYTFFNKAWINFTGHSLADSIKQGWEKEIHPDDQQSYLAIYKSAFEKRLPFQLEFRLKQYNTEYKWVLLNASPMFLPTTLENHASIEVGDSTGMDSSSGIFNGYIVTCAEIDNHKTLL